MNEQGAPSLPLFTTVMGVGDGDDAMDLGVDLITLSAVLVLLILLGLLHDKVVSEVKLILKLMR